MCGTMCAYLGTFLQLFLLESHRTYCEYFQTIEHIIYSEILLQGIWDLFVTIV